MAGLERTGNREMDLISVCDILQKQKHVILPRKGLRMTGKEWMGMEFLSAAYPSGGIEFEYQKGSSPVCSTDVECCDDDTCVEESCEQGGYVQASPSGCQECYEAEKEHSKFPCSEERSRKALFVPVVPPEAPMWESILRHRFSSSRDDKAKDQFRASVGLSTGRPDDSKESQENGFWSQGEVPLYCHWDSHEEDVRFLTQMELDNHLRSTHFPELTVDPSDLSIPCKWDSCDQVLSPESMLEHIKVDHIIDSGRIPHSEHCSDVHQNAHLHHHSHDHHQNQNHNHDHSHDSHHNHDHHHNHSHDSHHNHGHHHSHNSHDIQNHDHSHGNHHNDNHGHDIHHNVIHDIHSHGFGNQNHLAHYDLNQNYNGHNGHSYKDLNGDNQGYSNQNGDGYTDGSGANYNELKYQMDVKNSLQRHFEALSSPESTNTPATPLFEKAQPNYTKINNDIDQLLQCQWDGCHFSTRDNYLLETHLSNSHHLNSKIQAEPAKPAIVSSPLVTPKKEPSESALVCQWVAEDGTYCGCTFDSTSDLSDHIIHGHVGSRKKEYVCRWKGCDREHRPFHQRQKIVRHLQVHTRDKPFRCDICGKSFGEKAVLKQHQRTHSGEKPFKCGVCGKAFTVSTALSVHTRVHTGDKPLVCKYPGCNKRFAESSNLAKHMKTHSDFKTLGCPHEGCRKKFRRKEHLDKHLREVHG